MKALFSLPTAVMALPQRSLQPRQIGVFPMAKDPVDRPDSAGARKMAPGTGPAGQWPPRHYLIRTADEFRALIDKRTESLMFTRLFLYSFWSGLMHAVLLGPIPLLVESPHTVILGSIGVIYGHAFWRIGQGYRDMQGKNLSEESQQTIASIEQLLAEAQQIEQSMLAFYSGETNSITSEPSQWNQYKSRLGVLDKELRAMEGKASYTKMLATGAGWMFGLIHCLRFSWATFARRPAPKPWLNLKGRNHALETAHVNALTSSLKELELILTFLSKGR